jgi:hypothetical protein
MLVFSTSGRSVDEAFAGWRTAICGHFVPLRPEPSASCANFFGEVSSWPLAGLTLSNILATGQRIHRERPEISHSDRDVLFLTLQLTGDTGLVCDDQRKLVRPGDMYYLDARRPFALHCEGRVFSLTIPRQACDGRLAALAHLHGSVAKPDDTVGSLLRDYLCSLASAERNLGAVAEEDIADHLVTLISHAFARRETDASPPHGAVRAALFARAYRLIDRKLCDPDFDPARCGNCNPYLPKTTRARCAPSSGGASRSPNACCRIPGTPTKQSRRSYLNADSAICPTSDVCSRRRRDPPRAPGDAAAST